MRAEPRLACQRHDGIAVVSGEVVGIGKAVLFERVPDAVVGARLGKMVAAAGRGAVLLLDDFVEDHARPVDYAGIFIGVLEDHDTGADAESFPDFGESSAAPFRRRSRLDDLAAVVDQYVLLDG